MLIADAPRESGLRLDVGVLDESSLVFAFDDEVGLPRAPFLRRRGRRARAPECFLRDGHESAEHPAASASSIVLSGGNSSHAHGKLCQIK